MLDRITLLAAASLLLPIACSSTGKAQKPPPSQDEVERADWLEQQSPLGTADAFLWCEPFPSCEVSGRTVSRASFSTVDELVEILAAASFTGGVAIVLVSERNPEPFSYEEERFLEAVTARLREQGNQVLGLFYFHPRSESTEILKCRLINRCS